MMNEKAVVEGLIFLSGDEGLSIEQLKQVTQWDEKHLEQLIDQLMQDYLHEEHGIEMACFGQQYKFISKAKIHEYAQALFSSTKMSNLSQAALETLAIIAYKQPITRVEIEEIRGVSCDMMIRKLLARSFIKECGRSDAPGKPFLYEVTKEFMDAFKLKTLDELPELPMIQQSMEEDLFSES